MDVSRRESRQAYWDKKYHDLHWEEDIHFALFPVGDITPAAFRRGIKLNTEDLARDLNEMASIYRLTTGLRVLDFGCGAGDFLIRMAALSVAVQGVGVDLAPTAIERACRRTPVEFQKRIEWIAGGLPVLKDLVGGSQRFDVIVCRDMYYLLDKSEQNEFFQACGNLLRPGGVLYVADLAIEAGARDSISDVLLERQFGGDPITWTAEKLPAQRSYSITAQAHTYGFSFTRPPRSNESAVTKSYEAAAAMVDDPAVKEAYKRIAAVAGGAESGRPSIPYVRFYFCRQEEPATALFDVRESIGIILKQDLAFGGRTILRAGKWKFPRNHWSLILGRSGTGKTTLLRLLCGILPPVKCDVACEEDRLSSTFLLSQKPALIEDLTVQDNIKLFAKDQGRVDEVLDALGFDSTMALREANGELSGGEAQRVALGQAIAADPNLLLLDEPGVGIDRVRRHQLFSTIKHTFLAQKDRAAPRTVVCVDHDFVLIEEFFDCVFEILNGQLVWMKGT